MNIFKKSWTILKCHGVIISKERNTGIKKEPEKSHKKIYVIFFKKSVAFHRIM